MEELILSTYTSDFEHDVDYYEGGEISVDGWISICKLKDISSAMFDKRWQAAKDVIDLMAKRIGIDPDSTGHCLYGLIDGSSPIIDKMDEYFSRSGDKVRLKQRIEELETENRVLRSLVGK